MASRFVSPAFLREPGEVYRSKRAHYLTSHQLADFRHCPAYYRRKQAGLVPEYKSDDYAIGSAAHTLILEGRQVFDAEYEVGGPINPKTERPYGGETKKFAEWSASIAPKTGLSEEQYGLLCRLEYAVKQHDEAKRLLSQGQAEAVLRIPDVPCQVRLDWWNSDEGIVDLKTCHNLDVFEDDARKYQYVHQLAFYCFAVFQVTRELVPATLIAVEKQEPFRCGVWRIAADSLRAAGLENDRALHEWKACRISGVWPTRYETPRVLHLNPETAKEAA